MDQQKIGNFIAFNRKSRGMTQAELAEQLGVTNKAVSKWETGRCLPDAALFQPLCALLGITVNELLTGEGIPPEQAGKRPRRPSSLWPGSSSAPSIGGVSFYTPPLPPHSST